MKLWRRKQPASRLRTPWSWPDDLERAALQRIGEATLGLLRNSERWVYRRVERISFKDYETTRHQTSVDFTLPLNQRPVAQAEHAPLYVAPLFLLAKSRLRPLKDVKGEPLPMAPYSNIDVTDRDDCTLPLLTRRQSSQIAVVALMTCAAEAIGKAPSGTLRQQIGAIGATDGVANQTVRQALDYILDPTATKGDPRYKLQKHEFFPELAHMLARYSPIVCIFPSPPAGRSIIKIAYDEPTNVGVSMAKGRIRRSLGWKSELFFVRLNEVGASKSYHLEVDVPAELELNEIGLLGTRYALSDRDISTIKPAEQEYYIRQVERTGGGHLYVPDPRGRRVGAAWLKLRARRRGFLKGALVASIITSAVLILGALAANQIGDDAIGSTRSDAATALLLVLPSLLAAYIVRPGEHAITSRMLRFARFALAADGSLPFLAAFRLLAYSKPTTTIKTVAASTSKNGIQVRHIKLLHGSWFDIHLPLQTAWAILAGISCLFVLLFILSCALPRPHGESLWSGPATKY